MKTLKLLLLLIAASAIWSNSNAQCVDFYVYQNPANNDTVTVYGWVLPGVTDSALATLSWNFGDGQTATGAGTVQHVYQTEGQYNICFTFSSPQCTSTKCDSIYVSVCDPIPNLSVNQATIGSVTSLSINNAPVGATYNWHFNNSMQGAVPSSSTSATPQVTFPPNGNYWCAVNMQYGNACMYSSTFYVNTGSSCNAQWNIAAYGNTVEFIPVEALSGTTYNWNFGDGGTSNIFRPQYTYHQFGTYNVCLVVSNAGCADTVCASITTSQPPCPTGDTLMRVYQGYNGTYTFDPFAGDSVLSSGIYAWDFGDGTTANDFYSSPQAHTYATSGTYIVCLNYSSQYCSGVDCDTITVDLCSVSSSIQSYRQGTTLYYSLYEANPSWTYQWVFPGGTPGTSNSANPTITYPGPGDYYAYVEITQPGCGMDSFSVTTNLPDVGFGNCNPNFTYTTFNTELQISLVDSIIPSANNIHIDYGDGNIGTLLNHTYANYGTYLVCVTVSYGNCIDSVCQQVEITPTPGYIFGRVYKGSDFACNGFVYLIKEDSIGHLTLIDSVTMVDSAGICYGQYYFPSVSGYYYVKAGLHSTDPDYANYLPTYYGDELNWADATMITTVSGSGGSYNINLVAGTNPGGPGFIGGNVSEGAGLAAVGNGEERAVGDPIANVQINLMTDNGTAVAYTYTDGNGRYTFGNLALGSYKIYAEILDKTPQSQVVTLTANNPSQNNVDVLVNSNSAVTGINDIADIKVDGVFPNPVKDMATIRFTAKLNASATIKVTDMKGSVVSTINANIITGNNELKIDLTNHAAGVYTVSITNNDNKKIIKLLKSN